VIYLLAVVFFVGDLVLLRQWRAERRRHQKSRRALAFWRESAHAVGATRPIGSLQDDGAAPVVDQTEIEMVRLREKLRRQANSRRPASGLPLGRPSPVSRPGDAA
jgi:hypothetical protein